MFNPATADCQLLITSTRDALKAMLTPLFAMLSACGGMGAPRLSRVVHAAILRVLTPAESALRRVIVLAARDLTPEIATSKPFPKDQVLTRGKPRHSTSFKLFDPRKRFTYQTRTYASVAPRISSVEPKPPLVPLFQTAELAKPPSPDGQISARQLHHRLQAITSALENIEHQSKRLVRLQARRAKRVPSTYLSPLRIGKPPGFRETAELEIDLILEQCHNLARTVTATDTS
jgi:hypothetical protein